MSNVIFCEHAWGFVRFCVRAPDNTSSTNQWNRLVDVVDQVSKQAARSPADVIFNREPVSPVARIARNPHHTSYGSVMRNVSAYYRGIVDFYNHQTCCLRPACPHKRSNINFLSHPAWHVFASQTSIHVCQRFSIAAIVSTVRNDTPRVGACYFCSRCWSSMNAGQKSLITSNLYVSATA